MQNFVETDVNRFIEAQEVPYFCGYKQALEEVKNDGKPIIGYGIYFHSSVVWGAAVERIIMELQTETRHNAI